MEYLTQDTWRLYQLSKGYSSQSELDQNWNWTHIERKLLFLSVNEAKNDGSFQPETCCAPDDHNTGIHELIKMDGITEMKKNPTRNLTKLSSKNVCQCGCRTTLHNALHIIPQIELSAIHSSVDTLDFRVPEYPHSCSNANVSAALFGKLVVLINFTGNQTN